MPPKKAMAFTVNFYTTKLQWWSVYEPALFTKIACEFFFLININWTQFDLKY